LFIQWMMEYSTFSKEMSVGICCNLCELDLNLFCWTDKKLVVKYQVAYMKVKSITLTKTFLINVSAIKYPTL
jgi:hypothetical protein